MFVKDNIPITDGAIIDTLFVINEGVNLVSSDSLTHNKTYCNLTLKRSLPPKGSIQLHIKWHYTIPGKGFERGGAIDSTLMFIAYWYTEMTVYDDVDGWDRIVHNGATEFYLDYSDYEIEIEVPANFLTWASLAPTNEDDVYSNAVRERLTKARKKYRACADFSKSDFKTSSSGKMLKWLYTAKNFPDFSIAFSDLFVYDACMYKDSSNKYFINTAYPENHPSFNQWLKASGETLKKCLMMSLLIIRFHTSTLQFSTGSKKAGWNFRDCK